MIIVLPGGKRSQGDVIIIFEPHSGRFYGQIFMTNSVSESRMNGLRKDWAIYKGTAGLAVFFPYGRQIEIDQSKGVSSNIDDAQAQALVSVKQSIDSAGNFKIGPSWVTVPLYSLPVELFHQPRSANDLGTPKILDVKFEKNRWTIFLQGDLKFEIVLNEKCEMLYYKRLG